MFGLGKKPTSNNKVASLGEETVTLKITGMHCQSCAINIDLVLEELPGVVEANTNYATTMTQVRLQKDTVNSQTLIQAIASAGYTAQLFDQ